MFYAENEFAERIYIGNAVKGKEYYCPCCSVALIQKRGNVNAHHFAHPKQIDCDSWSDGMTQWHIEWQSNFPEYQREQKVAIGGDIHIADVLLRNVIIEFQHSNISASEFKRRCVYYSLDGRRLIWVFDAQKCGIMRIDNCISKRGNYKWWKPKRFLCEITPDNSWNIEIFLHTSADTLLHVEQLRTSYDDTPSYSFFAGMEFKKSEFLKYLQKKINYNWSPSYNYAQSYQYKYSKKLIDDPNSFCIR